MHLSPEASVLLQARGISGQWFGPPSALCWKLRPAFLMAQSSASASQRRALRGRALARTLDSVEAAALVSAGGLSVTVTACASAKVIVDGGCGYDGHYGVICRGISCRCVLCRAVRLSLSSTTFSSLVVLHRVCGCGHDLSRGVLRGVLRGGCCVRSCRLHLSVSCCAAVVRDLLTYLARIWTLCAMLRTA